LKLSLSAQKILEKKTRYPKELFAEYNRLKAKKVQLENQKIEKATIKEIRTLSKYELKLIGTALHWAEGNKRQPYRIQISNSDSNLIKIYLRFLREIVQIPEEKLKVSIRVHPNINSQLAVNFWSRVTNIPRDRFVDITTQISKASQGKRPKNSLPYGTLDLGIHGRQNFYKIKGWIDGLMRQAA